MENLFKGLFDSETTSPIEVRDFIILVLVAIVLGVGLAFIYSFKNKTTKSFKMGLAMIPALVCVVIMMVNGNLGAGVAVAGAFSLIRFRSAPGTAKEIVAIFLTMAVGLILGMGYIGYAVLFSLILGLFMIILNTYGNKNKNKRCEKTMHITIPEDLNYEEVFDSILGNYTKEYELVHVKTSNFGSLYKLTYNLVLKDNASEKALIDELRVRNGNLEISIMKSEEKDYEL